MPHAPGSFNNQYTMANIYLINVGVNTSERSQARSPIFSDGSFACVPFSWSQKGFDCSRKLPAKAKPFVRNMENRNVHCDPDWKGLTYGDRCTGRGGAMNRVKENDILLFWGLLWENRGESWASFTGDHAWYLMGAMRVDEILKPGDSPKKAKPKNVKRASQNEHFWGATLKKDNRVFIGDLKHSKTFATAIPFHTRNRKGLMFKTVRGKAGKFLTHSGKGNWASSTRACRAVWHLEDPKEFSRACTIRDAIRKEIDFDLLAGIPDPR